jgi:transposase-like protein
MEPNVSILSDEILDQLIGNAKTQEDVFGKNGIMKMVSKRLIERMMQAELSHHLKSEAPGLASTENKPAEKNRKNGTSKKRVSTDTGSVDIDTPRDRNGTFAPVILPKHARRILGMDERILAMYSRGMSTREIASIMTEMYGTEISAELVSHVTDEVREDIAAWQSRPLSCTYAVVWVDAIFVKIRDQGVVSNKALYVGLGLKTDGKKELLGLWLEASEGASYWQKVFAEWQSRGLTDILVLCCDGLKGLPQAAAAVYPKTIVQGCIVHQVRHSLSFVGWKERKAIAAKLREIYSAPSETAGREALERLRVAVGARYSMIVDSWERNWETLRPFFELPPALRRVVYTTNAVESLNAKIRKVATSKGHFPSDDAALKTIFLGLRQLEKKWHSKPPIYWREAYGQLVARFGDRALNKEI